MVGHRVSALPPICRQDFISRAQFRALVKHTLDNLEPGLSTSQRTFLEAVLRKRRTSLVSLWSILPRVVGAYLFVEAVQRAHWQLHLEEPNHPDSTIGPAGPEEALPTPAEGLAAHHVPADADVPQAAGAEASDAATPRRAARSGLSSTLADGALPR
ncbi:hypothetical protein KFE25_007975 [Diacronema lutheri]|uniref:Uncharacterized protein n=1 Tax=Diacronema lutheri TaxID=2081491 RepID=A0A8J6CCY5_DIALT|nr:hypothetical protein KFE25_007975 [Diacronema lutheri]